MNKTQLKKLTKIAEQVENLKPQLEAFADEIEDVLEDLRDSFESRSEGWQESDAGVAYNEDIENWEGVASDLRSALDNIDFPEGA